MEPPRRRPSHQRGSPARPCPGHARGDLRLLRHADRPSAEEYREPFAHRTGGLLGVCRPRFWEALAGSFGERTIGVRGGAESTLRAVALSCRANPAPGGPGGQETVVEAWFRPST